MNKLVKFARAPIPPPSTLSSPGLLTQSRRSTTYLPSTSRSPPAASFPFRFRSQSLREFSAPPSPPQGKCICRVCLSKFRENRLLDEARNLRYQVEIGKKSLVPGIIEPDDDEKYEELAEYVQCVRLTLDLPNLFPHNKLKYWFNKVEENKAHYEDIHNYIYKLCNEKSKQKGSSVCNKCGNMFLAREDRDHICKY